MNSKLAQSVDPAPPHSSTQSLSVRPVPMVYTLSYYSLAHPKVFGLRVATTVV
jgi:hypothetical protein